MRLLVAALVVVVVLVLFNLDELKRLTTRPSGSTGTSPQAARAMGTPGIKLEPGTAGQ